MKASISKQRRERKPARGVIRIRKWTDKAGKPRESWQADFGTVAGKRLMRSFATKATAETWLQLQRIAHAESGAAAWELTEAQRRDAAAALSVLIKAPGMITNPTPLESLARTYADCMTLLAAKGRTLREAAAFMAQHTADPADACSVAQAAAAFTQDAVDNNLRPSSIENIERRLRRLVAVHGERPIASITRDDADIWLRTFTPKSKPHFRVIAHGLFNYAHDRGWYTAENPFRASRLRRGLKRDEPMPECMSWRNVEAILQTAHQTDPTMSPGLAVGFFAGLRTAELRGLDWSAIDLGARRITVMPAVAKKRRARHITICDNLLAWLMPHRQDKGLVAPPGEKWRFRLDAIRETVGVEWPHNAMRHSFASHHLALHGDAVKTAMQLGHHRDTSMLFDHYRALVTPDDAAAYFAIRPAPAGVEIAFEKTTERNTATA